MLTLNNPEFFCTIKVVVRIVYAIHIVGVCVNLPFELKHLHIVSKDVEFACISRRSLNYGRLVHGIVIHGL